MTLNEALEIINKYLQIQGIKERVLLTMDKQTAWPLYRASAGYDGVLLKTRKYVEGKELIEADKVVDNYFTEKSIAAKKVVAAQAQSIQQPSSPKSNPWSQQKSGSMSPPRGSDEEMRSPYASPKQPSSPELEPDGSPQLMAYVPYQQPIPIPSAPPMDMDFNPKDFPPPAFSEACPTAIQPARQNFMPGYVAMVGKAKVDPALQAACDLINSLPTVKAKGIVLTLQSDYHTSVDALGFAITYMFNINDRALKKQIREADDILDPYFEQFKDSNNNSPRIAIKV